MPPANAPPGAAPPAAETAAAPAGPTAMTTPAMAGPLAANPDPIHFDAVPAGTVYMTGALSGLLLTQTDPILGDRSTTVDLSNAQVTLQNTDGWFQFFLEPGAYSLPTLGTSYKAFSVGPATNLYGGLPVAWGKIVPTDTFSIQGGQLPTLIGAEGMFTFQNMNIERGLLWAQEPVVSHGVQANLTTGPVAWSASVNDGYYSGQYNWLTGSATWTIDPANTLVISGGGAIGRNTAPGTFATPVAQNNSQIVEAGYTYGNAPWTITPYVQYTHVGADSRLGIVNDSSTIGAAVLANYKFTDTISLAGRFEYIDSSGAATGAGLLGYGPGSSAMSFTLTPTWQSGIYFVRGEGSYVSLSHTAPGFAFGNGGNSKSQGRFMLETGIVF
ncbi:MAG TPA: outer membrane beta-barrel protein [Stellaceae bacterium]|nr:outer membrane beta-barrel protein [Stellaceae bacterium]